MGIDSSQQGRDEDREGRFAELLQRLGLESRCDDVYPVLAEHYSGPGRYYHNLNHVSQCLGVMDEVRELLMDPDSVELALWFHDVVYDPGSRDNELRSALFFDCRLGVHLPTVRADDIHAMIMATVHPSTAEGHDEQFVADIDLSGLGLPWFEFLSDTELLRMECPHLSNSEFQLGALGFFKKLLMRPSIYLTGYFRDNYEDQARRNLLEHTAHLEGAKDGS